MGKVFAVTSGKGGVGKSTVTVGLADAFSSCKKRVCSLIWTRAFGALTCCSE